jgi:hypothetical protein
MPVHRDLSLLSKRCNLELREGLFDQVQKIVLEYFGHGPSSFVPCMTSHNHKYHSSVPPIH